MKHTMKRKPKPVAMPKKVPAMPMGYMANGGLVGNEMGCTGPSGGTGGVRSRQDFRK